MYRIRLFRPHYSHLKMLLQRLILQKGKKELVQYTKWKSDHVKEHESESHVTTRFEIQEDVSEFKGRRNLVDSTFHKAAIKQSVEVVPAYLKFKWVWMNLEKSVSFYIIRVNSILRCWKTSIEWNPSNHSPGYFPLKFKNGYRKLRKILYV